jgi:hypothetical protein
LHLLARVDEMGMHATNRQSLILYSYYSVFQEFTSVCKLVSGLTNNVPHSRVAHTVESLTLPRPH